MVNAIEKWHVARGLTMKALGDRVNAEASTISKLEKGQMKLTLEWIMRLATALSIPPSELLSGADGHPVTGLAENAALFEPPTGHALQPIEHVAYLRILTDDLDQHPEGITRNSILAFDLNQVDLAQVKPGRVVLFGLFDKLELGKSHGRLIGQFLPPNKVCSNSSRANWIVNIDDPTLPYEPVLRGVLKYVVRELDA